MNQTADTTDDAQTLNSGLVNALPEGEWVSYEPHNPGAGTFGEIQAGGEVHTITPPRTDRNGRQDTKFGKNQYTVDEYGSARTYRWEERDHRIKVHVDTQPDVDETHTVRIESLD